MKIKALAACSPFIICVLPGLARADLQPFSFGASETLQHDSNIYRNDAHPQGDWLSTTELRAALDEAIGRERLVASGSVDLNRYKQSKPRNSTGYSAAVELDWSTVGDVSGALGADAQRVQYVPGASEVLDPQTGNLSVVTQSNLQSTRHVFARATLGGDSRWQIFTGVDASRRSYSATAYRGNDERQWSANAGTNYATGPDLSFGVVGSYLNGEYPHYIPIGQDPALVPGQVSKFTLRSASLTTKWQASGNSAFTGAVGYTTEDNEALSSPQHFINGSVNWMWTPPSRFKVTLGLKRSSDADSGSTGANTGSVNVNNLNGSSVNNIGLLDVNYELTAKVSLDALAQYTQRRYADLRHFDQATGVVSDVNGSTRTVRFYMAAHYLPTRTTDVSCGVGRETRKVGASLSGVARPYTNTSAECTASIKFE